jgi:lipopolysaccharide/colanic/teichoic acid biosynthesis glycosyltransferase
MKTLLDRLIAVAGLLVLSPILVAIMYLVRRKDGGTPLYIADRAAKDGGAFKMIKIRSMVVDAASVGGTSTASDDPRVTTLGRFIRRWKIDEISQLWNVARGDMSLVGPRPQVLSEVAMYTADERRLLTVRPGITDFASIVFADEAEILRATPDPDLAYRHLIRPWKSRLGLFYVDNATVWVDLLLIALTGVRVVSARVALAGVSVLLAWLGAPADLVRFARRTEPLLLPTSVPGLAEPLSV